MLAAASIVGPQVVVFSLTAVNVQLSSDAATAVALPITFEFYHVNNYAGVPNEQVFFLRNVLNLINNMVAASAARVIGCSQMQTNANNKLTLGGLMYGYQVPPGKSILSYLSGFKSLGNLKGFYRDNADLGAYGWHKPVNPDWWQMQSGWKVDVNGNLLDLFTPFVPDQGFTVLSASLPAIVGNQPYESVFELRYGTAIEYQTEDNWRDVYEGRLSTAQVEAIMDVVKYLPQFYSNDFHVIDLWNQIKGIAQKILPVAKGVVGAAGAIPQFAAASKGIMAVLEAADSLTKSGPAQKFRSRGLQEAKILQKMRKNPMPTRSAPRPKQSRRPARPAPQPKRARVGPKR
jgi:hypothetical protein